MCYAKPGPRCYGHAVATEEVVSKRVDKLRSEERAIQQEVNVATTNKKHEVASQKLADVRSKFEEATRRLHEARVDKLQTSGGIQQLRQEYKKIKSKHGENSYEARRHRENMEEAEAGYEKRLREYDEENHTVHGKLPSGYASAIGLAHLKSQAEEVKQKLDKSRKKDLENRPPFTPPSTEKLESLREEHRKLVEQRKTAPDRKKIDEQISHAAYMVTEEEYTVEMDSKRPGVVPSQTTKNLQTKLDNIQKQAGFARLTLRRIESGSLSRLYAPPAPALRKTEAFQSYIQSAHAAPDVKTTARELRAVGLRSDGTAAPHPTSKEFKAQAKKEAELKQRNEAKRIKQETDAETERQTRHLKVGEHVKLQDRPYLEQQRLKANGVKEELEGQEILF